ncbi:bifunctional 4-hydroxy-2-oxoglutarate aldolase/2-dehydro-3-deoxy-phosphogluconate aldolase [Georgenia sp. AZ-5]|uniref:bifunctional 4-hydroxy-2-oxoglutarate aldolase/2-dehydro-3-deoxy-phosphogluconate aldolase n=1 Tax=Georgenia sp. AZ-5 TaxID=3367526 RepID=UPI0037549F8E
MSTDTQPTASWFDEAFTERDVMVILRGRSPGATASLCHRAWDLGIAQVEVPVQSPDAMPSLLAAIAAGAERGRQVGAGTVTSVEQLEMVANAGVSFTVAPGLDEDVIRWSTDHGLPHLPGVSTPSEIQRALRLGSPWLKVFPASVLGPEWFRAVRAPFPHLRMVATGGVTTDTARRYHDAGARVISLGSALEDERQLEALPELLRR